MMSDDLDHTYTAETIEEAVEMGLKDLGLTRNQVDVEILDEGNKGIFGLGARLATVRLIQNAAAPAVENLPVEDEPDFSEEDDFEDDEDDFEDEEDDFEDEDEDAEEPEYEPAEGDFDVMEITKETVHELLEKMGVRAKVAVKMGPPDERTNRSAVHVDITGSDMSILIGRKAETLNALQYITRLIVGKELGRSALINIDVQGYRRRKEESLRRLAQTVAKQAIETGRRQYLEPMSPAERRIIHIELRDNPDVVTESFGEGSRRKVTISPSS